MKVQHIRIPLKGLGKPVYISLYSDLHMDSASTDWGVVKEHMVQRAKLKNHYGILLGDMCEWILPNDLKRYRPTGKAIEWQMNKDALVDELIKNAAKELKSTGIKWLMVASGNHEDEVLKRHYVDPAGRMASLLKCKYGGYSGMLVIHFDPGKSNHIWGKRLFTILYHHGAWGGRVVKGFGGARDWARMFEGWDVFVFGHNHQLVTHVETRLSPARKKDRMDEREIHIVTCGTWLKSTNDKSIGYSERRGHPPIAVGSPLLKITPHKKDVTDCKVIL